MSFHVIKNTLNEFGGLAGLFPNLDKSCCFFDGASDVDIVCLERIMNIPIVLFGISNYWGQCIFLPCGVCKEIENFVRTFLWTGAGLDKYKSNVAWSWVGRRKDEGGLGIKSLQDWNISCMSIHLWNICSKNDTLWVKWINTYKIKGACLWSMKSRSIDTWVRRKFMHLRD
ncbi:hypothetical protein LIER_27598 [Lithospermum erythrorhizon]|uniref:Uncharacterized protein n=1 Tax=Lithospermum erythrorhizon TaxID=34254 RepID=A0AAV3RFN7_LITER